METELSFGQTNFLLWVPPFLSYELWKLRIELRKHLNQTGSKPLFQGVIFIGDMSLNALLLLCLHHEKVIFSFHNS